MSIEEALASIGTTPNTTPVAPAPKPPIPTAPAPSAPVRTGPSPFELDQMKREAPPAPMPSPSDDWRAKLHAAMTEKGLAFSADAIAQSEVALVNNERPDYGIEAVSSSTSRRDEVSTALKLSGVPGASSSR